MARGILHHIGFCDYCGAPIFADLWEIDTSLSDIGTFEVVPTCNCVLSMAQDEQGIRKAPH